MAERWQMVVVLAAGVFLTACAGKGTKPEGEAAGGAAPTVEQRALPGEGATATGTGLGTGAAGEALEGGEAQAVHPLDQPDSLLSKRVVYFDFDSAQVKEEYRPIVEAHAKYLATHPSAHVVLEGHADERGTREYNMALGERRANAVKKLMVLMGADPDQIDVVSYGEERPAVLGHDESAWSKNRRVEIVYKRR